MSLGTGSTGSRSLRRHLGWGVCAAVLASTPLMARPAAASDCAALANVLYQRHQAVTCVAQSRVAIDLMRSGCAVRLFQAWQHASTMAS